MDNLSKGIIENQNDQDQEILTDVNQTKNSIQKKKIELLRENIMKFNQYQRNKEVNKQINPEQ